MSIDLIFSLEQEICNGEVFLVVHVGEKGNKRIIYIPMLKEYGKKEKELAVFLIKERCYSAGILPNSSQSETLSCNTVRIRGEQGLEAIRLLIKSKGLLWKGRSLFFNPLSLATLSFEVEASSSDSVQVSGFFQVDGKKFDVSFLEFLFLGKPIWAIHQQIVIVFSKEVKASWLRLVYPQTSKLEGREKKCFLEDFKEDPDDETPRVVWKGEYTDSSLKTEFLHVLPILILRDSRGAFADLQMEYEGKQIAFEDPLLFPGRDLTSEKSWEKDLVETDFMQKVLNSSHYYCPMDKVVSSLSFLLDIGWKIIDVKGRRVMKVDGSALSLLSSDKGMILKGTLRYGDHKADVTDVIGAFTRQQSFVEISQNAVGLLDQSREYEGIEDLTEVEIFSEGCLLRSRQWGLLDDLLQRKDLSCNQEVRSLVERLQATPAEPIQGSLEGFQAKLRPYQETGLSWLSFLHQSQLSGLLADEMGLGKTVQVLAFLSQNSFKKPILLIVPTSLVFNWKKEWDRFLTDKKVYVHQGNKRSFDVCFLQEQEAILTSYALLRQDALTFQKLELSCVVLDEAQWMKNPESQLAKALCLLKSDMRVCLTGTPIENRAEDLWSLFHFLEPELLGEKKNFFNQLQAAESDVRYKKRIQKKLRPFILRRLKEEVAKDLPEKIEQTIWVEMPQAQKAFYDNWLAKTKMGLLKKVQLEGAQAHRMEIFEAILRLRQICCHPALVEGGIEKEVESAKMERVLEDLEEIILEGRKALVYSQFTEMLSLLKEQIESRGWNYVYLDGSTKDRESVVDSFQTDPSVQVFLVSLKAGGVGLNLTAADYVLLFDPWWNEAVERQAIDRAHRFGRKYSVIARRYIMAESIEEKMMKIKHHKRSLAKSLLEWEAQDLSIGIDELVELLQ